MSSAAADAPVRPGGQDTEAQRVRLGSSPFTPAHVLAGLACDPAVTVRATVAMNPACPPHIDHAISQDADERVRTLLARRLAPSLADRQARETLAVLAADPAPRVRAAVAACLKGAPDAPRALILQLAQDAAPTVCDPVVRWSPLLTEADLLALLAAPPHPGIGAAIASRPGLSAAVADALAVRGGGPAIHALIAQATPDDEDEALMASIRQLDAAGALNEATLIDAARAGDLRRVAAVLAVASGLTLAAVDRASAQRHARALIALAWNAGFSMRAALVAQVALGRLGPGALIPAGPGGGFPLTADEMQWQLEVLAGATR